MLQHSINPISNKRLKQLVAKGDKETIIRSHLRLASSLAKRYGMDDELFDAAIYGLVLGTERLGALKHDNVTGYLVLWMKRHIKEAFPKGEALDFEPGVSGGQEMVDLDDSCKAVDDTGILDLLRAGYSSKEVQEYLGVTRWAVRQVKGRLKEVLCEA